MAVNNQHKLRVLWSSVSPQLSTGYGRVSREIITRLHKAGFDIIVHGCQHQFDQDWNGIKILKVGEKELGADVLKKYFKNNNRDILITLYDIWKLDFIPSLNIPWIPYFPIDAEPLTSPISNPASQAFDRICFSDSAKKLLDKAGMSNMMIPHGVDTKIYKPIKKQERERYREKIGIKKDDFIVGTVGMNIFDRKDFPRLIRTFAEFVKKNDTKNAYLYIHAQSNVEPPHGFNISTLAKQYEIEEFVKIYNANPFQEPLKDSGMAKMYNTFDVYMTSTRAEGCCLPILEAQACGVPCIVPDYSATPEWIGEHGWKVPATDYIHVLTTPMYNHWHLMDVAEGIKALEDAYYNIEKRKQFGALSHKAMLEYDWDKIVNERWIPYLNDIEKKLKGETRQIVSNGNTYTVRNGTIDELVVKSLTVGKEYTKHLSLTKEDVWLDVGGHIGSFSIDIADKIKNVYSFEPNKDNFQLYKTNLSDNKKLNVHVFNFALVANEDKTRILYSANKQNTGGGSLIGFGDETKQNISCKNINKMIEMFKPNKIKLDCEGSEYELLKAIDLNQFDEIIFEYHFNILGLAKYEELIKLLSNTHRVLMSDVININGQTIVYCRKR